MLKGKIEENLANYIRKSIKINLNSGDNEDVDIIMTTDQDEALDKVELDKIA